MKIKHTSFFDSEIWSKTLPYLIHNSPRKFLQKVISVIKREYIIYSYNRDYVYFLAALEKRKKDQRIFKKNPKISILLPTYNSPTKFFRMNLDSVLSQNYTNWELCIADDCSTNPEVIEIIKEYAKLDSRIRFILRPKNGHISEATNSALGLATGDYIALLDHDDLIYPNTLEEYVALINRHPHAEFIYCDEDKIDTYGRRFEPHFKPDWSPETLLSGNYITHFAVVKKRLIDSVNGLRKGYEGSQDYDLFLRISEKTKNIYHIPKVLYSWRTVKSSTATRGSTAKSDYAYKNGFKALQSAFNRRQLNAKVSLGNGRGLYNYIINHRKPSFKIITFTNSENIGLQVYKLINSTKKKYLLFLDKNCHINFQNIQTALGLFAIPQIKILSFKMLYKNKNIFKTGLIISKNILPAFYNLKEGGYFNFNYSLMTKNYSATSILGTAIDVSFFKKENLKYLKKLKNYTEVGLYLSYLCIKNKQRIVVNPTNTITYSGPDEYHFSPAITQFAQKIIDGHSYDPCYNPNLSQEKSNFSIRLSSRIPI